MPSQPQIVGDTVLAGSHYGILFYSADAPVFSADRIQTAIAVFDSRYIDASSTLLSWKELSWVSVKPMDTDILVYWRSSGNHESLETKEWSGPFLNGSGEDMSDETGRYLQIRMELRSSYDPDMEGFRTPIVSSFLASCFLTSGEQVFYTKEIELGFKMQHLLLTYNGTVSSDTMIRFAVVGQDTTSPVEYQTISPNHLEELDRIAENSSGLKIMIGAVGSKEIPFVIDEFAVILSGDGQKKINKDA